jgi:hypothetical protein
MNNEYMLNLEEAQTLCEEIGEVLQKKTSVTTLMDHKIDQADVPQYSVWVPFATWKGKYIEENAGLFIKNPEIWQEFQKFILRSAQFLGYEQMEKEQESEEDEYVLTREGFMPQ